VFASLVLDSNMVSSPIATGRRNARDSALYSSTEVAPRDECDGSPIDSEVVRAAVARVDARPPDELPAVSTGEPSLCVYAPPPIEPTLVRLARSLFRPATARSPRLLPEYPIAVGPGAIIGA